MNANCVPFQQSPLGSIDFLALSLHIVSVISTPIHIIAIFCILKRSSESLESLKWSLLNYHSMVIFFSYSVNFFESPYILLPAMAGTSIGFLDQFSVDCQEQIYFLVLSLACKSFLKTHKNYFMARHLPGSAPHYVHLAVHAKPGKCRHMTYSRDFKFWDLCSNYFRF